MSNRDDEFTFEAEAACACREMTLRGKQTIESLDAWREALMAAGHRIGRPCFVPEARVPTERDRLRGVLAEIIDGFDAEIATGNPVVLRAYVMRPMIDKARDILLGRSVVATEGDVLDRVGIFGPHPDSGGPPPPVSRLPEHD